MRPRPTHGELTPAASGDFPLALVMPFWGVGTVGASARSPPPAHPMRTPRAQRPDHSRVLNYDEYVTHFPNPRRHVFMIQGRPPTPPLARQVEGVACLPKIPLEAGALASGAHPPRPPPAPPSLSPTPLPSNAPLSTPNVLSRLSQTQRPRSGGCPSSPPRGSVWLSERHVGVDAHHLLGAL